MLPYVRSCLETVLSFGQGDNKGDVVPHEKVVESIGYVVGQESVCGLNEHNCVSKHLVRRI